MRRARLLIAFLCCIGLWAGAALARQDDPRLKELFAQLQTASSPVEAREIERQIWRIWTDSGDAAVEAMMRRGLAAMAADDTDAALAAFSGVVALDPGFAEGFNKRATVLYVRGEFAASVADIERTLALEPRHFGALSGLGQIYLALGNKPAALKAFEAALKIDPRLESVAEAVRDLKEELDGKPT